MTTTSTISLQTIHDDTRWVAKMQGWRHAGTFAEVGHLMYDADCRDFDTVWSGGQPENVRPFWEAYEAYGVAHGFMLMDDFYRNVYAVEALKADPSLGEYVERDPHGSIARARREAERRNEQYALIREMRADFHDEGVEATLYGEDSYECDYDADLTAYVAEDADVALVDDIMRDYGYYFLHDGEQWGAYYRCYVCVA